MKCKRYIVIYFPVDGDFEAVSRLVLELGNYFGLDCVRKRAWKKPFYRIFLNGSSFATARSVKALRAKFWQGWHKAKKLGINL